ncbi:pfs domain-containing protein [Colletotrichum sojae]|uniref:Pfs domain-containing protein n=1 Tax=Colletotrichum sojae TaxID=2175907 RepID=A0A8H6MPS6_9PEZI|nr:pfs domain-containing protein [Colletotrichum sojae]
MYLDDASHLLATLETLQEAADILKTHERSIPSKIFFGDLKARCLILHEDLSLVEKSRFEADIDLIAQMSNHLESVLTREESSWRRGSSSGGFQESRLHAFKEEWETSGNQENPLSKLEIARSWLDLTQDDLPAHVRIRRPPHSVCTAVQSIFKALVACKTCKCKRPHEFDARFRLGTYRKPELDPNLIDFELNFDTFLMWERDWQEAHIKATEETKHKSAVQFVINDGLPTGAAPTKRNETMVRRLCKHIKGMRDIATYRLELKVAKGKLFQLEPTRSTSRVDKTKEAVSLAQVLERPDAVSTRANHILSVLLSSAVLHLHSTPNCIEDPGNGDVGSEDDDSDSGFSDNSDDFDLTSFMCHQSRTIVSLAVVLTELYSGKPFRCLAEEYAVSWDETTSSPTGVRYLNVCEVFAKWKEEVPENTQFLTAVDKCLDRRLWEKENGQPLESDELRTKFYDEVVKRLEVELSQAFSKTPIDELDEKAAELDFGN